MKRIAEFLYKQSTIWLCLIFTAVMIAYAMQVMGGFSDCFQVESDLPNALGLSFGYSLETAHEFFSIRSKEMIVCYKNFILIWDNIFPIVYGLMYVLWISLIFKNTLNKPYWINLFPIVQVLLDWIENLFEVNMANQFLKHQALSETLVYTGSFFSMLKWFASILCYLIILTGIVLILKRYLSKKSN